MCESERVNESGEALVKDKSALNFEKALLETESLRLDFQVASMWIIHVIYKLPHHTQVEIEPLRLDFQVDAKWQISHIRSNPNIKTEPQRLDL